MRTLMFSTRAQTANLLSVWVIVETESAADRGNITRVYPANMKGQIITPDDPYYDGMWDEVRHPVGVRALEAHTSVVMNWA